MPFTDLCLPRVSETCTRAESGAPLPATMPWLASTMIAVRPTLKIALCPKFSMASVDVLFSDAASYVCRNPSYLCAS